MALSNKKRSLAHSSVIYLQNFLFYRNLSVYQCSITPTHFHCHIIRLRRIEISRFYLSNVSNFRNFFKLFLFIFVILAPVQHFSSVRTLRSIRASRTADEPSPEPMKSTIFIHFLDQLRIRLNQPCSLWRFQIIKSKLKKEFFKIIFSIFLIFFSVLHSFTNNSGFSNQRY